MKVIVTGASSGIGRATAVELARRGHRVFAAARRRDLLEELSDNHRGVVPVTLDVTDEKAIAAAMAEIDTRTGRAGAEVLINAAGYALTGPVETLSAEDVRRQFETNVFGLLAMTRAVLPGMRARRSGRLLNVSSVLGRMSFPTMGVYSATKYAVESLSDALRMELAPFGIKVVLIEPGFVSTDIVDAAARERVDTLTSDQGSELAAAYNDLTRNGEAFLAKQVERATPATLLARVIADAAEVHRPRARYAAPTSAKGLVALMSRLPDRLADAAKRRAISH